MNFEDTSRLTYYSSFFNSIEINSSFFKVPQALTDAKWASSVSRNFKFTYKLWKAIAQSKGLNFNKEDVFAFFKTINSVKEKKGCLLVQFLPGFENKSWYHKPVYDLLNLYKVAIVIHGMPESATPLIDYNADFIYIKFHGPTGNYKVDCSEDFLNEYVTC